MAREELPDQAGGVQLPGGAAESRCGDPGAAGPGVTAAENGVQLDGVATAVLEGAYGDRGAVAHPIDAAGNHALFATPGPAGPVRNSLPRRQDRPARRGGPA